MNERLSKVQVMLRVLVVPYLASSSNRTAIHIPKRLTACPIPLLESIMMEERVPLLSPAARGAAAPPASATESLSYEAPTNRMRTLQRKFQGRRHVYG